MKPSPTLYASLQNRNWTIWNPLENLPERDIAASATSSIQMKQVDSAVGLDSVCQTVRVGGTGNCCASLASPRGYPNFTSTDTRRRERATGERGVDGGEGSIDKMEWRARVFADEVSFRETS